MGDTTSGDGSKHGSERDAIVVGGGIGGLATALALIGGGWRVRVVERADALADLGSGLSLWPNGLRALDALGVGESLRDQSLVETEAGIRDVSGRWLSRTDLAEMKRRYGPLVVVHRADLMEILRQALPADTVRTGTAVLAIDTDGPRVRVEHTGGTAEADLVVGADGIHSTVRNSVWPLAPQPRYAGYTAWRLVVPVEGLTAGGETWGRGERFGVTSLPGGRAYLFGTANVPAGQHSPDGELAELRRRFGHWHEPIPTLLAAATEAAVLRHDIYELPPLATYVTDRVALLGDAAHAMTPNLGQGANQALEDAVALAMRLDAHPTIPEALTGYDRERRPWTQMIAKRSRRIGVVGQFAREPGRLLRDQLLRLTPDAMLLGSLAPVFGGPSNGRTIAGTN